MGVAGESTTNSGVSFRTTPKLLGRYAESGFAGVKGLKLLNGSSGGNFRFLPELFKLLYTRTADGADFTDRLKQKN
jgi:hypothetical protein